MTGVGDIQGLDWMLGRASSLVCRCHSPIGDRVCSPVVAVEALMVGVNKATLPLSACPVSEEVTAEAS